VAQNGSESEDEHELDELDKRGDLKDKIESEDEHE
jgi:hypothetical protein